MEVRKEMLNFAAGIILKGMEQQMKITPGQYELLNILSCINKEEDVVALKSLIVKFLNTRLQNEMERLWENGTLTEEKVAAWENEHMRTPYK
ncbi:MAG: dephospho-CoA kinase [Prevotella sp.]|nr:dephospho-CoA kinase [Prevotella sp.]